MSDEKLATWYSVTHAAAYVGISRVSMWRAYARGSVAGVRADGRYILLRGDDVRTYKIRHDRIAMMQAQRRARRERQ